MNDVLPTPGMSQREQDTKLTNRELEENLLGEIATESEHDPDETRRDVERLLLTPEHFGFHDTRTLFKLMLERLRLGDPCSAVSMNQDIKKAGIPNTLILMQSRSMGQGLKFRNRTAFELKDLAARRKLREVARDLLHRAHDESVPVHDSLSYLSGQMNQLVSGSNARIETLDAKLPVVAAQLDAVGSATAGVLKTGIGAWDKNIGGLYPTLTVIGGHPSRGKSALAASIILGLAKQGIPGIIFTLEDAAEWLLYRYLALVSRVPSFFMRSRPLDENQQAAVGQAWNTVRDFSKFIMFDERSRLTPAEVVSGARDAILTRGAKWVLVDHLGEVKYGAQRGGDRFDLDVAEGLSDLRAVAKTNGVPIVALSQLSRSARIPHTMQDFKNASAIEEQARVAAIVWTNDGEPLKPTVTCVKNTFGKRDFDMKFELDATSALLIEPTASPPPQPPQQGAMF